MMQDKVITRTECKYFMLEGLSGVVVYFYFLISVFNKELLFLGTPIKGRMSLFLMAAGFIIMTFAIISCRRHYAYLQYMDMHGVDYMYASDLKNKGHPSRPHQPSAPLHPNATFTVQNEEKKSVFCPYCGGQSMVPAGRGNLRVLCPHCNQKFNTTS